MHYSKNTFRRRLAMGKIQALKNLHTNHTRYAQNKKSEKVNAAQSTSRSQLAL